MVCEINRCFGVCYVNLLFRFKRIWEKNKKLIVNVWINDSSNIVKYKGGVFCYLLNK